MCIEKTNGKEQHTAQMVKEMEMSNSRLESSQEQSRNVKLYCSPTIVLRLQLVGVKLASKCCTVGYRRKGPLRGAPQIRGAKQGEKYECA